MQLVTYRYQNKIEIGVVQEMQVIALTAVAPTLLSLIKQGPDGLKKAQLAIDNANQTIPLAEVELLAPIPVPERNIMCLGWNYAEHAKESATTKGLEIKELPQYPIVFTKATTSVNGPFGDVPYNTAVSTQIDYEVELAIIIGKQGSNIPRQQAMNYVYGYTVLNDISARDLQRNGKQFFKGKSLDGFCPIGPWLITANEIADPQNLAITCRVNGVTKQNSSTKHMIFDIPAIIEYLSLGMTLRPGDIIATGTPSGVGFARTPPEYLQPGDIVESEIEQIGLIRNQIQAV
jgi:2-keto-4-pentenoate hydratase/2-oxohepta-3-ene-1,7-dioic acid hydratase in catechol pathway